MTSVAALLAAYVSAAIGLHTNGHHNDLLTGPHSESAVTRTAGSEGFVELNGFQYLHQVTPHDDAAAGWFTLQVRGVAAAGPFTFAGTIAAEKITGGAQGDRVIDFADRDTRRSALSLKELTLGVRVAAGLDLTVGRFEPAWGRTDAFSPADAFLARDLSDPFDQPRLPIWAARLQGERDRFRVEGVHSIVTTPWRLPNMSGRFSPGWYADVYLNDPSGAVPRSGFDLGRVSYNGGGWDVGVWGRTGVRPAPVLTLLTDDAVETEFGVVLPVRRHFADETAAGVGATRVAGGWIVHGELAYLSSPDAEVRDAILWSLGVERSARSGLVTVTVAGNAKEPPVDPLRLADRAFLPYFVATVTQAEDWGNWQLTWLATMRRIGGILKAEVSKDLTDRWRLQLGADLPHGSRTSSPGALSQARRVTSALRWSW